MPYPSELDDALRRAGRGVALYQAAERRARRAGTRAIARIRRRRLERYATVLREALLSAEGEAAAHDRWSLRRLRAPD